MNNNSIQPLRRRSILQAVAASACLGSGSVFSQSSHPQASDTSSNTQAWRAMSRVGYGPSATLARAVQAAPGPRAWALQQVDIAWTASQRPPRIAADLSDFNAPLPRIFEGFRHEREARAKGKEKLQKNDASPQAQRMDFSGLRDPEHFSRMLVQQASAWRLSSCSQPDEETPTSSGALGGCSPA